jgi:hypothetical protein
VYARRSAKLLVQSELIEDENLVIGRARVTSVSREREIRPPHRLKGWGYPRSRLSLELENSQTCTDLPELDATRPKEYLRFGGIVYVL